METTTYNDVGNCGFLPEVLVIDILTRLPVKSLIRFRCVSKRWKDLIRNPTFVSKHTSRMKSSYNFQNSCDAVVVSTDDWMGNVESFDPNFPSDFLKLNVGPYLTYKPSYGGDGCVKKIIYTITGYCDGIFCLSWNHLYRHLNDEWLSQYETSHIVIALCNPALREIRILPLSNTDFPPYKKHSRVEIGFGFDPKTNDYKVVKLVTLLHDHEATLDCIEVYSMESNSWRMILVRENNNYASSIAKNLRACAFDLGIYTSSIGGVLHWTMTSQAYGVIGSFHMDNDSLHVTQLPPKYTSFRERTGRSSSHYISLLHDKLALICSYHAEGEFFPIDIFLLNNYDDDDSCWYLATIIESFPCLLTPLGFLVKSFLLVFHREGYFPLLYDIVSKQIMDLDQITSDMGFGYRESLVSVKRGCNDCYSVVSPRDFQYCISHFNMSYFFF